MVRLWLELVGLFFGIPLLVYASVDSVGQYLMVILIIIGAACLGILLRDNQFKRFRLWHWGEREQVKAVWRCFFVGACLLAVLVLLIRPDLFLAWPFQQTRLWIITLLIYPLVSVIPQEIIYRTFFFHRYKPIMPSRNVRLGVSTFAFALAHIVYGNWIAVLLSLCGGALFGYRYLQTCSTPIVVMEHALWGCFMFTVGMGAYLMTTPAVTISM